MACLLLSTGSRQHFADDVGRFGGVIDIDSPEVRVHALRDIAIIQDIIADLIIDQSIIIDIYGLGK